MDSAVFASIAEKTIIGAGFFYLLHYLIKNMELISENLKSFGDALQKISEILLKIDMRVEQLEDRIQSLECKDSLENRVKDLERR